MARRPSKSDKARSIKPLLPKDSGFASELETAKREFREGRSKGDGGRRGARRGLQALIVAVQHSRPDLKDRLEPLYHLLANLDGLETGRVDPMFRPRRLRQGGAPPASEACWLQKETTAVAVSMLLDDERFQPIGKRREEAANRYAEKRLRLLGMKAPSKSTVGNWRAEVMAHVPGVVGVPNKTKAKRLNPDQFSDKVQVYMKLWCMWQDMRDEKSASTWIEEILSDDFRSIVASADAK